jgi:hypothetical protein
MADAPTKEQTRKAFWSHVRVLVVLAAILIAVVIWISQRQEPDSSAVGAAKQVVERVSSRPSTIKFFGGRLAMTDGPWRVVTMEYDAQNEFGATIRHRDCVVFRWADGGKIE